jgi:hypothetical protein
MYVLIFPSKIVRNNKKITCLAYKFIIKSNHSRKLIYIFYECGLQTILTEPYSLMEPKFSMYHRKGKFKLEKLPYVFHKCCFWDGTCFFL